MERPLTEASIETRNRWAERADTRPAMRSHDGALGDLGRIAPLQQPSRSSKTCKRDWPELGAGAERITAFFGHLARRAVWAVFGPAAEMSGRLARLLVGHGMLVAEERAEVRVAMTRRTGSDIYQIIVDQDGGYDLALNGEVIRCFHWRAEQLEQCIHTLDRLLRAG